jgi:uncharacterized membrane protein YkoI
MITAMSATLTKEVDVMKRIAATIVVAALVVTASALSGLIPSAGLLNGVWADDEAKGAPEQRDEKVSLDQVPLPVKATIERESAGGQVTGISQATERGEAAYAVKIAKDGQKMTIYVKADGTVPSRGGADDAEDDD